MYETDFTLLCRYISILFSEDKAHHYLIRFLIVRITFVDFLDLITMSLEVFTIIIFGNNEW